MPMKLIRAKDYEEMSKIAGEYFVKKVRENPKITLGLATGSTPVGMYQYMVKDHKNNGTSYRGVVTFNLDEYVGLEKDDVNSYHYFMHDNLFNHIDIDPQNVHIPNGTVDDAEQECKNYEESIRAHGGIDIQLLGIGANGHIGFNEPGSSFSSRTRIVELTPKTRQDNSRFFDKIEDVPTHAITMGMATILESKEIVMLISGKNKQEAMRKLLSGEVTEDFPASALHNHKNVTVIADEEALEGISEDVIQKYL